MSSTANNVSDRYLKLSHDRKVSPRGVYQASRRRWIPTVPNSFGLPAGDSCPGKTPFCESCYAKVSENSERVGEAMRHNLALLQDAGSVDNMTVLLAEMVHRYVKHAERVGLTASDRIFRIHWDGDFFSRDYAEAWGRVIRAIPDVTFWAYTRSFVGPVNVVPILSGIDNLVLYLSADSWNIEEATRLVNIYPDVRLALCAEDYETGRALSERRAIVCPENAGKMPLMREGRGACVDCQLCPQGRSDVIFSTSHREFVEIPAPRIRRDVAPKVATAKPDRCRFCHAALEQRPGPGRPRVFCNALCRERFSRSPRMRGGGEGPGTVGWGSPADDRVPSHCLQCGAPMQHTRGPKKMYCNAQCRRDYYAGPGREGASGSGGPTREAVPTTHTPIPTLCHGCGVSFDSSPRATPYCPQCKSLNRHRHHRYEVTT